MQDSGLIPTAGVRNRVALDSDDRCADAVDIFHHVTADRLNLVMHL